VQLKLDSLLTDKKTLAATLSIVLVLLGFGSWCLLYSSVRSVLLYKSPYTFQVEPGLRSQPLAQRLVLVIVDGLQSQDFEAMLTVKDIAGRGVAVSLRGSRGLAHIPASTVLMTGALPEISGVITNWFSDRVMIDSLWSSAHRAGLNTVIIGDNKWKPLFGHSVTQGAYRGPDDKVSNTETNNAILKDAITEITQGKSQLILVSFLPERDFTYSSTGSVQQRITREETAASIDMRLRDISEAVDLSSGTVVFVSGSSYLTHDTLFGFSKNTGDALLVAAGAGIMTPENPPETIQWISGRLVDIAPTCASLLGISMPTHSQGEVMYGVLDLPDHTLSEITIRQTAARARFALEYMNTLSRPAIEDWSLFDAFLLHNDGDYRSASLTALSIDEDIISVMRKARSGLVSASRLISIPILAVIAVLLIFITTMFLQGDIKDVAAAVIGVFCYFTAYYGLMFIKGTLLSSSAILSLSEFTGFYHSRIADSIACATLTAVIIGWVVSGRKDHGKGGQGFFIGLIGFCFVALALFAHIAVFVVTEGSAYAFYLPDIHKGFRCFMYLIQLTVAGILSPVLAGLSEAALILTSKARSSKS
jgi:hypothetical protein